VSWVGRTPWPVATTALGTSVLVLLVSVLPSSEVVLPFVGRVGELALAGGAAYLVDDAAAAVTTVAPRGTWRRRAPVLAVGTVLIGSAWVAILLALAWHDVQPSTLAATGELVVLGLVAVAAAAALVRSGDQEPGGRVAPAMVLLGVALLVLEGVLRRPLLVPWDESAGAGLLVAWTGVGLLALLVALWVSRDPAAGTARRARLLGRRSLRH
jgi:hypothetical protein